VVVGWVHAPDFPGFPGFWLWLWLLAAARRFFVCQDIEASNYAMLWFWELNMATCAPLRSDSAMLFGFKRDLCAPESSATCVSSICR
jgi:hypothetical protein